MILKKNKINKTELINKNDVSKELFENAKLTKDQCLRSLSSDPNKGLSLEERNASEEKYGKNILSKAKEETVFIRLLESFSSPFIFIMLFVAIVSGLVSYLAPSSQEEKMTWWITPLILIIIILMSGLVGFVQKNKSLRSTQALKSLSENTSTIIRDNAKIELPNSELVVGDIVALSAGDMVPADIRVIESKDLFVSQASLTGESEAVEKNDLPLEDNVSSIFDAQCLLFSGSNIVSGQGKGIIIAVGDKTIFGQLAKKVVEKKGKTAFEKGIDSVSKLLVTFLVIMLPIVFLVDGIGINISPSGITISGYNDYHQWIEAFVFAITVAVGIMPSLLPMQVASNLAKGALKMSEKKVIVKDINTIQNFGAMDVLCTDKTGTLTEASSTLCDYFNLDDDNDDDYVLQYAYLNSYFQSGIRSVIDKSIIYFSSLNASHILDISSDYQKIDELPFDFHRKRLSVFLENVTDKKKYLITKGACKEMLETISKVKLRNNTEAIALTDEIKEKILRKVNQEERRGRRVILLAIREMDEKATVDISDEKDMIFLGFLSFEDKVKSNAESALNSLRHYGVEIKVLTGDNLQTTLEVTKKTGFTNVKYLSGEEIAAMDDNELQNKVEEYNIFYKLSPDDKYRIVKALKENKFKHTVGFMGDGINDAPSLRLADVGISFKDATDIAKEAADIVMMENNLEVLKDGIIEGRKSYVNMMKYLKGQTSSNFGNMISQSIGALWIPFMPMRALHLILLDIITDISCGVIPFDKVDESQILKPLNFSSRQIRNFMFTFGPISSLVDMLTFALLMYYICPMAVGSQFNKLWESNSPEFILFMTIFQSGFFLESLLTQNVVYAFLRTEKLPLIQSFPSITLSLGIIVSCLLGFFVIYVPNVNIIFDFSPINPLFILFMIIFVLIYSILTTIAKYLYKKHYGRLL